MHENIFNKTLPHTTDLAWKAGAPLPADPRADIFHAIQHGQFYRQRRPGENPDGPVKGAEGHDVVAAVQETHAATVALWLAGSWRCNLGEVARLRNTRSGANN